MRAHGAYTSLVSGGFTAFTARIAAKIGFDDDEIYHEVALPIRKRKLLMKPLLREEALVAFKEWANKPDKIPY